MNNKELVSKALEYSQQVEEELLYMAELADELKPKKVLEIGFHMGAVSFIFAYKGAYVTSIDIDPHEPAPLWNEYNLADKLELIHRDSNDIETMYLVEDDYDLILIDGAHTLVEGQIDWDLYNSLAPVIAIHDITDYENMDDFDWNWWPGRFWKQIKDENKYVTREISKSNWGGWGIVFHEPN